MGREAEGGAHTSIFGQSGKSQSYSWDPLPVEVALAEQPGHVEPCRCAELLELLVVHCDIRLPIVAQGSEVSIVLQLVLQLSQLLDNLLALLPLRGVVAFRYGSVRVIDGLGLGHG